MIGTDERPLLPETMPCEAAQAQLEAARLGDGLPLVAPTRRRLDAMLGGVKEPTACRAVMPPMFGELTALDVAYQCVLAGCVPGAVPLVLTAAMACTEPEFNLLGIATTTGSAAVALAVHGPVSVALGLNAATGCLGPGCRANATIGRALALVLRNIAGARPGTGDMATIGQPGKYTFCFAEHLDGPLPALPSRRGLGGSASAVTVLGVSGTAEVLPQHDRSTPQSILDPLALIMQASIATSGAGQKTDPPDQVFLLPPELARQIVAAGWDLDHIARYLHGRGVVPSPAGVHPIVTGGAGIKMAYLPLWSGGSRPVTRVVVG